jgi:hypothetical protein
MKTVLRLFATILILTTAAIAAEPPALRRPDAKKVLEAMEWRDITIVTIQQGINGKGVVAPIFAHVVALGTRDGKHQHITQSMFYDEEYGWFFYELGEKSVRMWTKEGFKEIKPWSTW